MLSSIIVRKISLAALLLGLGLALVAPALLAARASVCGMACCRPGMARGMASEMAMQGAMPMPGCSGGATCSLRGCGGELPAVAPGALPPSVLRAALPLPLPQGATAPLTAPVHRPDSLSPDLPDQPPRA